MPVILLLLQAVWDRPMGDASVQILAAGERVVVVADRMRYGSVSPAKFVTLDAATGRTVAEFETNLGVAPAFAAADGEAIFATDGDGRLLRMSPSGRVAWSADGDWRACEPVIAGDRVVVAGPAGTAAYARETGERLWVAEGVGSSGDWVIVGDRIWVGGSASVTALDPAGGSRAWRADVSAEWMRLAGGRLVCAGGGRVSALDGAEGTVAWTAEIGREIRDLVATDRWVAALSAELGGETVFRGYRVHVYDSAGARAWDVARGDRAEAVAIEGGTVFVGADAFAAADGRRASGRFPPARRANGLGFVVEDGSLRAIRLR